MIRILLPYHLIFALLIRLLRIPTDADDDDDDDAMGREEATDD